MAIDSRIRKSCPFCTSAFVSTGQTFILADILDRWQTEAGIKLRESVWHQYTRPTSLHVTLYRCRHCGFARFEPPLAGSQEFYADITAKDYYVVEKWEFFQAIRDIKRHKSLRVLDIGCGNGEFLSLLRQHTKDLDCVGYEFSPEAAESARSRGYTVHDGPFPQSVIAAGGRESFDVVCVFQVIEHIVDPYSFISSIKKLVRPGGMLIISVPNADGPLRFFSDALTDIPPHHVSRWCASAFRIGMPRLGFKVKKVAYEPLPDYLWEGYLPTMWESNIWPAVICGILDHFKRMERSERIRWFIRKMKILKVRWLRGVPGHTLYTVLQLVKR